MPLSPAPLAPAVLAPRPHLVLALTARERKLFFGDTPESNLLPQLARCSCPVDAQLSNGAWEEFLRRARPAILLTGWGTPPLPTGWLESADCSLRYVCHLTGSVRKVVPRSFLESGGLVTNWGGFAGPFAAEHALLLALASLRNLNSWRPFIAQPANERELERLETRSLFGRQVGLHGFGSIARSLVTLLRPFGITLHAYSAGVPDSVLLGAGVKPCASLKALFQQSEILFECEALTAATEGTVSAAILAALPDDAVFVNVGRGRVVDESALGREAASGRIRVAVDVTSETMTTATELFHVPEVILSPHIAGPSHDQYHRLSARALQNIERYLRGEPTHEQVTLEIYDRST